MRVFFTLLSKELKNFFLSSAYYIAAAFLVIINTIPFLMALLALDDRQTSRSLVYYTFNSHWFWISFAFIIPLVTMRSFSEEKKLGTMEVLLTSPISLLSILLAKFFACLIFFILIWVPSFGNFLIFNLFAVPLGIEPFEEGQIIATAILILTIGCFYTSLGCFASSLTDNEVAAAGTTLCAFLAHLFLGYLPFLTSRLNHEVENRLDVFSLIRQMHFFSNAYIDSKSLVFYISGTLLFLFLTYQVLNFNRWKK